MLVFERVAIIGQGLIGSSISRAITKYGVARQVALTDASPKVRQKVAELGLGVVFETSPQTVADADLVVVCVPVGQYGNVAKEIGPHLKSGAVVTDVGSVKSSVVRDMSPWLPKHVFFVPSHPVAGTEESGPEAGFAHLFVNRWCIITPLDDAAVEPVTKVREFWQAFGANVETMSLKRHDEVLALISHLPHLIAFSLVGTASHHEEASNSDVIKFAAGGFRDFTRIAASNPTVWRDIFLNNREIVLEMVARFTEDLAALVKAIRWGDGDKLHDQFSKSRIVRRRIVDAGQDTRAPDFGRLEREPALKLFLSRPYATDED